MKTLMHCLSGRVALATAGLTASILLCAPHAYAQGYTKTKLVSDLTKRAPITDANLVNPWGLAAFPGAPWWVSDNGTGLSTLYDGSGNVQGLVVTVPPSATGNGTGTPTGIIANSTADFGGGIFIFDSEDGTISSWFGAASAVIEVDNGTNAVYKGLTQGTMNSQNVLYAANFRGGSVDVFDTNYTPVTLAAGAFTDPQIPAGYAPFNVQAIDGSIFVTFAQQDSAKHDEVDGPGLGYVDIFSPEGTLQQRMAHGNYLNAPWGLALAPSNFGQFSGALLVGNFGSGAVVAFNPLTGAVLGSLKDSAGTPILTSGIWGLAFGNGTASGPTNSLYFTAGIKGEAHGLFGAFTAN